MTREEYAWAVDELNKGRSKAIVIRDVETVTIIDEPAFKDKDSRHRLIVVDDIPVAGIWYNKDKPPLPPYQSKKEEQQFKEPRKRGQYTHGEQAYSRITSDVVDLLTGPKAKGNIVNQQAAVFVLSKYVEWGTGRLIKARKDKKGNRNMQLKDIEKVIGRSSKLTRQIVNDLIANNIIRVDEDGYLFNKMLITKGSKKL